MSDNKRGTLATNIIMYFVLFTILIIAGSVAWNYFLVPIWS